MHKGRLEAFSDGVFAILITIMVLELKAPYGHDLAALRPLLSTFVCYALSFVFLTIYWNNHHHMLQAAQHVNGRILWANAHLLFWLSLIPFTTAWMGQGAFAEWPVALYGIVLFCCAVAYTILVRLLVSSHGRGSTLAKAIGGDFKGNASLVIYAISAPLAFVKPAIACAGYVLVALTWLLPDRRIEKLISK